LLRAKIGRFCDSAKEILIFFAFWHKKASLTIPSERKVVGGWEEMEGV